MPQRASISNEEKWAPEFKARRERLTLQFYANAIRFMTRVTLTLKLLAPNFEGQDQHQFPGFVCSRRRCGQEPPFF